MRKFDNYKDIYLYIDHYCDINLNNNVEVSKYNAINNLYMFLEDYLNITSIQFERLIADKKELDLIANQKIDTFKDKLKFTKIFADIHFTLVSIEKSYNIVIQLYNKLNLKSKGSEIRKSSDYLSKKRLRNILEHMDENIVLPSDINHSNWFIHDTGVISNNTYEIKGYKFELSVDSISLLYSYYDEITSILMKDYVEPVKETVDKLWASWELLKKEHKQ